MSILKDIDENDKRNIANIMNNFKNSKDRIIGTPEEEKNNFNMEQFLSNFIFENIDIIYIFSKKENNDYDFCARLRGKDKDYYFILIGENCFVINDPNIFLPFMKKTFDKDNKENEMYLNFFIYSYLSPNNNLKYQPDLILNLLNDEKNLEKYANDKELLKYYNIISKLYHKGFVLIREPPSTYQTVTVKGLAA